MPADGERMALRSGWLWLALGAAFSPTLAGIVSDLGLAPRHAYVLAVALLLGALCARGRGLAPRPRPRSGLALLALGLLLELVGLAGETQLLARAGLPVAALGLALWLGAPSPLAMLLGFWLVPLPNSLVELTSPALESRWAALAARALQALGVELAATGVTLEGPHEQLVLRSENGGLLTAHCLGAVGWFVALWRGAAAPRALASAARGYALGFALQPLALLAAGALVAASQRELARALLTHAQWLLAAALWIAVALGRGALPPARDRATSARADRPIAQL